MPRASLSSSGRTKWISRMPWPTTVSTTCCKKGRSTKGERAPHTAPGLRENCESPGTTTALTLFSSERLNCNLGHGPLRSIAQHQAAGGSRRLDQSAGVELRYAASIKLEKFV